MAQELEGGPLAAPHQSIPPAVQRHGRLKRILTLLVTAFGGIAAGSYVSAELLYVHDPEEVRTLSAVFGNSLVALVGSPISMSLGTWPTLHFYASHGFLVIPGALMAIVGTFLYYRRESSWMLLVVLVGCALWAHNNLLAFQALMSV